MTINPVDLIGDVHGCADKLQGLLAELGYRHDHGAFRHPDDRTVIFVGDLIDRGSQQVEVLEIVRSMVKVGSAQMLMGNHEFNAISYVTPDPRDPGAFMRPRTGPRGPKNRHQHEHFLGLIGENSALHHECIAWFKTLPLYADFQDMRVVHACWHDDSIKELEKIREPDQALPDQFFVDANMDEHPSYEAVEILLKGPEVDVGPDGPYVDKDGQERTKARISWWKESATTLRDFAWIPPNSKTPAGDDFPDLPELPSDYAARFRYQSDVPVFFGHYWFDGNPKVVGPHAACLDYSAILRGRPLVAYRWEGESVLDDQHLVSFTGEQPAYYP